MKLMPVLAALPLLCAPYVFATDLMSVGYFNGGGDVTAGPGGDIDKLDVRQITHLNYSFGLIYNNEAGETNDALKDAMRARCPFSESGLWWAKAGGHKPAKGGGR